MSNPLKWPGGKSYLAKRLIKLFPDHVVYAEPFFGGGSVLFAKDANNCSEVVNDLHAGLSNFWMVLSDPEKFREFAIRVNMIGMSSPVWHTFSRLSDACIGSSVEQAVAFFVKYRQSTMGMGKSFAIPTKSRLRSGMDEQVSAWLGAVDGLPEAHARLIRVKSYCEDAVDFMKRFDSPTTFFYLDPPYILGGVNSLYDVPFGIEDHRRLLDHIKGLDGKFLLSGYDSDLYRKYATENGWQIRSFNVPNSMSKSTKKKVETEMVWGNYHLPENS